MVTTQHNETIRGKPTKRSERTLTQELWVRGQRKAGQKEGRGEVLEPRGEVHERMRKRSKSRVNGNKQ